ncbi:hypothetical protein C8255_06125 [filamentous cyanobacterium CCP3]|nr:hypothetical protein C8255_06125 [filamentous cyanobacterium CCP3]
MHDPEWWILGKLWAYRSQTEPFIHIDSDVFLWKSLPNAVAKAPVLAQNPEYCIFGEHHADGWWYRPEIFDIRLKNMNGWLPEEWNWYTANRRELAYCCGIFGGNHVKFINHYADLALKIVTDARNQSAFSLMENKPGDCLLIEQYFLAACLEYHKQHADSNFQGLQVECLFESPEEAFSSNRSEEVGYTHLIGRAKQSQEIAERVEKRVAQDYPHQYERCLKYLKSISFLPALSELKGFRDLRSESQIAHDLSNALNLTHHAPDQHIIDGIGEIPADGTSFCTITITKHSLDGTPLTTEEHQDELFLRTTGGLIMDATGETHIRSLHLQNGQATFRLISEASPKLVTVSVFGQNPNLTKAEIQIEFI